MQYLLYCHNPVHQPQMKYMGSKVNEMHTRCLPTLTPTLLHQADLYKPFLPCAHLFLCTRLYETITPPGDLLRHQGPWHFILVLSCEPSCLFLAALTRKCPRAQVMWTKHVDLILATKYFLAAFSWKAAMDGCCHLRYYHIYKRKVGERLSFSTGGMSAVWDDIPVADEQEWQKFR